MSEKKMLLEVKRRVEAESISALFLNFIDLRGQVRTKIVYARELLRNFDGFFYDGISVTGSLVDEVQTENDYFIIRPIPETFTVATWGLDDDWKNAFVLCDLINTPLSCRAVLKRLVSEFETLKLKPMCGNGITYKFPDLQGDEKSTGYYRYFAGGRFNVFNQGIVRAFLNSGLDVEFLIPSGPNCSHIALMSKDLPKAIDNNAIGKWIAFSYMLNAGERIEFCKPFDNAAPLHLSIWDEAGRKNMFYGKHDKNEISQIGYSFVAGVLHYFDEILAVLAASGGEFPKVDYRRRLSFSDDDSIVSVPCFFAENKKLVHSGWSKRCVFRGVSESANLYLVLAGIFAAGLAGIRSAWSVEKNTDNGYGIRSSSLYEKQLKLQKCRLFRDLFGDAMMHVLIENLRKIRKEQKNGWR